MLLDCAIIGGGPAGLSAALMLGRARRAVMLFDDNRPRNAVTLSSHGYLTRDGVTPSEFRALGHADIRKYRTVAINNSQVIGVKSESYGFAITTAHGERQLARTIILATGMRERLPAIFGLQACYGKSMFSCPYCDGWELRDKALVIVSELPNADYQAMLIRQWSRDLLVCTNGMRNLSEAALTGLALKGIGVIAAPVKELIHEKGQLQGISFMDGSVVERSGGFVTPIWEPAASFGEWLGCMPNARGGIATDGHGRTSVRGVYAAGDNSSLSPSQLIIAAGEGSKAAISVNQDLIFNY